MRKRPIPNPKYTIAISRRNFGRCTIRSEVYKPTYTAPQVSPESRPESTNSITDEDGVERNQESDVVSFYRSTAGLGGFDTTTGAGLVGSVIRRTPSRAKSPTAKRDDDNGDRAGELGIPWGAADEMEFEFGSESAPEEFDNFYEDIDEIDKLTMRSDSDQDRTSTITPSEKAAFQKIFSDIFARSQPGAMFGTDGLLEGERGESEVEGEGEESYDKMNEEKAGARETLNNIVGGAIQDQSREEMEAAIRRYPPALRGAAARAIGLRGRHPVAAAAEEAEQTIVAAEAKAAANADNLERLRKPESDRVEGLMRSAKTDFELWAVLEKEVFPLIAEMGLEEAPEEKKKTPAKKKAGKKSSHDQDDTLGVKSERLPVELDSLADRISPLEFYGPLYPSYLLLGLRLLNNSFVRPSPLTLAILPQIKSLGIISHVLGASTQLYNELLQISWYRHDNFRGVLSLLQEMEEFGLEWDTDTLRVIDDIINTQNIIRSGDRGATLKVLWSLPEFAPDRFKQWKRKIGKAVSKARSQDTPQMANWTRKTIV